MVIVFITYDWYTVFIHHVCKLPRMPGKGVLFDIFLGSFKNMCFRDFENVMIKCFISTLIAIQFPLKCSVPSIKFSQGFGFYEIHQVLVIFHAMNYEFCLLPFLPITCQWVIIRNTSRSNKKLIFSVSFSPTRWNEKRAMFLL